MIIHKRLCSIKYGEPEGEYYLCNEAVKANPDKMSSDWNKVTCKNCLKQNNTIGTQEWNNEMFKKHATPTKGIAGWIEKQRAKEIITVIKDLSQVNELEIIEVGCEAGNLLSVIRDKFSNSRLIGIDISSEALKKAWNNVEQPELIIHDITKKPFNRKGNNYDVIICSEVLEHIPSPNDLKAIENISKMCNKDTIVIITIPYETLKNAVKRILKATGLMKILFPGIEESKSEWHVQDYSKKEIRAKLEKHFEIIHYENILMLHQMIVCKVKKC